MNAAMNKAQRLLQEAPQARVMRVDLERGVMTVSLPDGFRVSKEPVVVIPVAEAACAANEDLGLALFPRVDEPHSFLWNANYHGMGYEVRDGGAAFDVYLELAWDKNRCFRRGSFYRGSITRTDSDGLTWTTHLPRMVTNDFGILVKLQGEDA
jgi:hypothetical protein